MRSPADHEAAITGAEEPSRARFRRMDQGTREDWQIIGHESRLLVATLVDRVLDHLRLLHGVSHGLPIDRLTHSLQTATRALSDGRDEEYVVCALLHDIGEVLGPFDHGAVSASILVRFVSPKNLWMLRDHGHFQGDEYGAVVGVGQASAEPMSFRRRRRAKAFAAKYDIPSFDPDYPTMTLEAFEPMLRRVMRPKRPPFPKRALRRARGLLGLPT